ncbi:G-type lectin S-receptor-like serine/threonine-protein kinase At4g11900 isoform X1 [Triticum dicoccoides]|uniref:G-type lectin S-receptor-like serine/threonine-protein kinase At4g11900 isoform X1 n=1 Tax=Triticum dicoccoides TaxID=85692 RepID=UPI000E7C29DE|nr:G-type lectin S-receptor-like serine/threonine-protein kinase At4g11900 isoform X1 [Triticum dicoccoides]
MVDMVGPREILRLALAIRQAAETVRQNREDCLEIQRCVNRLHGIMSSAIRGTGTDMIANLAVSAALGDLERILRRALDLVTTCQRRSTICHCFTAGRMSGQLLRVQRDIAYQLLMVNFAQVTSLQITTRPVPREDPVYGPVEPWDYWMAPRSEDAVYDSIHFCMEVTAAVSSSRSRLRVFSMSELEAATNSFSCEQVIHDGDSVTVYKGVLPDGSVVAIKRSHDEKDLLFPVHLQHKNVVTSLGYCPHEQGKLVVEEYMPNGMLSEMINEMSEQLDWPSTLQTVQGIAEGVAYLQTMRVVHPDLKPSNIFFDSDMNPKIGGLGKSKLVLEQGVAQIKTEELLGTVGNIPPEYISDGIISMKSNVFSFGVLFLRIISGMRGPVLNQHPIAWALGVWEARQTESFGPSPQDQSERKERERCICIGLLCTQMDPRGRPTMPDVLAMLNGQEELPSPELSCFTGIGSAEQEQPWWRSSWWKRRSDGRNWSLLEKTR